MHECLFVFVQVKGNVLNVDLCLGVVDGHGQEAEGGQCALLRGGGGRFPVLAPGK